MEATEIFSLGKRDADRYLSGITFFREIERSDLNEYELVLSRTKIYSFQPGEVIWREGDSGTGFYYISRGNLLTSSSNKVGTPGSGRLPLPLSPGEIIGDIAMFIETQRDSTIVADPSSKEVVLVATDFQSFGVAGIGDISLQTKLVLYRILVNNIRWKLELARMEVPGSAISQTLRKVPIFKGQKGSRDELSCLMAQGKVLANILKGWNNIPILDEPLDTPFDVNRGEAQHSARNFQNIDSIEKVENRVGNGAATAAS